MSAPAYPSMQDYLDLATRCGCTIDSVTVDRDARNLHAVTITAPSGRSALEIVSESSDPLMSTTIARLDRRLGMKSHLFR